MLSHGRPIGRFVLIPEPGIGVPLEARVVGVAIADQVGSAWQERSRLRDGADVIFVAVVIAFFAIAVAYVRGCERIVGDDDVVRVTDVDDARRARGGAA